MTAGPIYQQGAQGGIPTTFSGNVVIPKASGSGIQSFQCDYTYAKGHNQAAFPAEKQQTISYATVNVATTPQYQHRIDEVQISQSGGSATRLDSAAFEVDGLVLLSVTLTSLPTITAGNLFIHCIDLHYQTTGVPTKAKAPNFYT